jgi:drug/metabolite transporter (DMT)-like permease
VPALSQTRAYLALVIVVILWGSYPAMAKLAMRDFPPFFLAAARSVIASAFLALLLARAGADTVRGITPAALRAFLVLAVVGIWGSTQWTYVAIHYTSASNAVILQAAVPVLVTLTARFYLGERLRPDQWAGVAVSALGVLLVVTRGHLAAIRPEELRAGDFINLAALCGWSAYTVYGKQVLASYSPALATTAAYVLGTLLVLPTAVVAAPYFPPPRLGSATAWLVVLYQAILGAVAHLWWYKAVQAVGASRAAVFMNLQPVTGLLLAVTLLGERAGVATLIGGVFVLVGVALTTRGRTGGAAGPPARATT